MTTSHSTAAGEGVGGHTPGPWRVGADLIRVHTNWRKTDGEFLPENLHRNGYAKAVAAIGKEDGDWRPIGQQVADARLIAAAPDMLTALETASWLLADISPDGLVKKQVDAAIAKAREA